MYQEAILTYTAFAEKSNDLFPIHYPNQDSWPFCSENHQAKEEAEVKSKLLPGISEQGTHFVFKQSRHEKLIQQQSGRVPTAGPPLSLWKHAWSGSSEIRELENRTGSGILNPLHCA